MWASDRALVWNDTSSPGVGRRKWLRVLDNSNEAMSPVASASISKPPPQCGRKGIDSAASVTVLQRSNASEMAIEIGAAVPEGMSVV